MAALLHCLLAALLAVALPAFAADSPVRLKDLGKFAGWRDNSLVGYGLVTGLAGTGDSPANSATRQMLANMMARFGLSVAPEQVSSRNAAAVIVSATLPPVAAAGDALDVVVTSSGDARSLAGGSLLLTELRAANGRVYALAQGALAVGGYRHDMNGNVVQMNHPTVGAIPGGGTVEVGVRAQLQDAERRVTFTLAAADLTTAARAAQAINGALGAALARARDAESIEVQVPVAMQERLVEFLTEVERVTLNPDQRARVVVNERTGTVVSGGDVRIAPVAISHGDLKVSIVTDNTVAQPIVISRGDVSLQPAALANSRVSVQARDETGYVSGSNRTVAELIQVLTRIKTNTRDIIAILQTLKASGALHAELVIQ